MGKRYQVFVSSTYTDLVAERQAVIQLLLTMDCIPAGMELFPAADEEQWAFIKRVIDDCDYYVLMIKGRYGSTTPDGVSYTEKEYDYAIAKGIRVLAFVHEGVGDLPDPTFDSDPERVRRLAAFREKVMKNRLAKYWKSAGDLQGMVAVSLQMMIKMQPAIGWVRGDKVASAELLEEVNTLRKTNTSLRESVDSLRANLRPKIQNLARLSEEFTVRGKYWSENFNPEWSVTMSWSLIFGVVAPHLLGNPNDIAVKHMLTNELFAVSGKQGTTVTLNDLDFQTVKVQLIALGLVRVEYSQAVGGGMGLFWYLTPPGNSLMLELRAVRTSGPR